MSNIYDLSMDQGSSFVHVFTLIDPDSGPYNLTGYDARLQVRKAYGDTSVQINCTLQNGKIAISSALGGTINLSLAPADTSGIRFLQKDDEELDCVYDLEIQSPSNFVTKVCKGAFLISREVTR